ncbi:MULTISPECIES: GNAT family N-acetyltransferase [unclassified Shimia]|uniref:GNAT family N-acetyltransferase n=1 Tax=unclassified Shimia TaxID=2630038 RepID=UPI0031025D6B
MYEITGAKPQDAARLADIRVAAMRDSLEAVGRFDPVRARHRLLDSFVAEDTKLLWRGEYLAGFFVVRNVLECLYLDHLYVAPNFQSRGAGRFVVTLVQETAALAGKPVRLVALNGSPANGFYQACGFRETDKDTLDTHYEWVSKAI